MDRIFCLAGMTVREEPAGTGERVTAETLQVRIEWIVMNHTRSIEVEWPPIEPDTVFAKERARERDPGLTCLGTQCV